ncbi:protein of unknown function (plasmid) [Caballeronia sp. S22]
MSGNQSRTLWISAFERVMHSPPNFLTRQTKSLPPMLRLRLERTAFIEALFAEGRHFDHNLNFLLKRRPAVCTRPHTLANRVI